MLLIRKITLEEIERRAERYSPKHEKLIEEFKKNNKGKDLKRGRVRPRDPVEERILKGFERQ